MTTSRFESRAEEWWATNGALLLAHDLRKAVLLTQYHPLTFHLPGETYTPDFLHIMEDGELIMVEVKGSTHQRNYRDARSKLRAAAEIYSWAAWYQVLISRNGCDEIELIGG